MTGSPPRSPGALLTGAMPTGAATVSTATGCWPAFWASGAGARATASTTRPSIGELDVVEFHRLRCGVNPGGPCKETTGLGSGEVGCGSCTVTFHTYAVELDRTTSPQQLRFHRDSTDVHTVRSDQLDATAGDNATDHGCFPIVNLAMGGGFPGAFGAAHPTAATPQGVPLVATASPSTAGEGGRGRDAGTERRDRDAAPTTGIGSGA